MFPRQINLMAILNILDHYVNHTKIVWIIKVKFQQSKILNYKKKVKYFIAKSILKKNLNKMIIKIKMINIQ